MTLHTLDTQRSPKGDHNRRIALGYSIDDFAALIGVSLDALHAYETTAPDHDYDVEIGRRVGVALDRLEAEEKPSTN